MASNVSGAPSGTQPQPHHIASDWTVFAACLMIFGGLMAALEGIDAIVSKHRYLITRDYVYKFNVGGWGWFHLVLGILIVLVGVAIFTGAAWAKAVGVIVAGCNMVVNFLWLPYAPLWSIVLIGVDIFIIWALTATHKVVPSG